MFQMMTTVCRKASGILAVCVLSYILAAAAGAVGDNQALSEDTFSKSSTEDQARSSTTSFQLVRTDSPREVLKALLRLTGEFEAALLAYQKPQTRANAVRIYLLGP